MKKLLVTISLIGLSLLANQNNQNNSIKHNQMINNMYMQMKNKTLPFTKEMVSSLKIAKSCIEKAKSKEDAKKCANDIKKNVDKNTKSIMDTFGIDKRIIERKKKRLDDFEWNERAREKAIKNMTKAISDGEKNIECMEKSSNFQDFSKCMKKK